MVRFGSEDLEFEVVEGWGQLPEGWKYHHIIGIDVDKDDNVYIFNRGDHPVIVFNRDGIFQRSWGEGLFGSPHGMYIGDQDNVYLTDTVHHTVFKFTLDGELLDTYGTKGEPHEGTPFNRPTDIAIASTGEMYVSDGYGNSRVHKFSADGELLYSWGEPGDGPGQFDVPHDVDVYKDGRVFIADRQNHRIQIFDATGKFLEEWTGFQSPCAVYIGKDDNVYIPELRARMSIMDIDGNLILRWGGEKSDDPGMFRAPHCTTLDSHGDLYIGESLDGSRIQKYKRIK